MAEEAIPGPSGVSDEVEVPEEVLEPWPGVSELLPTLMARGQAESDIKSLQEQYKALDRAYGFPKCPVVDDIVGRLLPQFPYHRQATVKDKGLMSTQFKMLDIVKPLIMLYYDLSEKGEDRDTERALQEIQLWAEAFCSITRARRKNLFPSELPHTAKAI